MFTAPLFKITAHHIKLIDEISTLKERIQNSKISVAWKPILQREAILRSAMGSTAIEGYVLSMPEVEALSNGKTTERLNHSETAVLNYLAALKLVNKSQNIQLSHEFIKKLHSLTVHGMLKETAIGNYRAVQNYVVNGYGQAMYIPPKPQDVQGLMDGLIRWGNIESTEQVPVVSSAILHYQFVSIHPFVDGNGRVARLLGTWELIRRKFDTQCIFAIDDLIYEHKSAYYAALKSAQHSKNDITHWLEYYLEIVAESLDREWRRIASLPGTKKLKEALELTPKQEKALKLFGASGRVSARELAKTLKISVQGVHFILGPLIKAGMVKRFGGRKTGKFGTAR